MTSKLRPRNLLKALPVFLALLIVSFCTLPAHAKEYEIARYDIQMQVTADGLYLITEHITYDFIEGSFTQANREVLGKGFDSLRFISIEGVDHPIESHEFKDGRNLKIDWTYPPASGPTTFIITYEAHGGLSSKDGANIVDWNPIGSGWDVPIHDIDITIILPEPLNEITALPTADLASPPADGVIRFHRAHLPAHTYYHVVATFPEIIPIVKKPLPPFFQWALLGLVTGLIVMVVDIRARHTQEPQAAQSGPEPSELSLMEVANLYTPTYQGRRRGIAATIFALGQAGKLRLVVTPKRRLTTAAKVHVDIISDEELDAAEQLIVAGLKRRKTLQRFAQETTTFNQVIKITRSALQTKGLISTEQLKIRQRTYLSSIVPLVIGVGSFTYGAIAPAPVLLGLGILLFLLGLGRIISAATITVLTPAGLYAQDQVETLLDAKMGRLEESVERQLPEAITVLFDALPYLVLHKRFTTSKLNRLKKHFRQLAHVESPEWIVCDPSHLGKALDSLTAIESIDAVFIAIFVTAGSTGATGTSGAGAAGSGAGGGGGGAG